MRNPFNTYCTQNNVYGMQGNISAILQALKNIWQHIALTKCKSAIKDDVPLFNSRILC